MPYTPQREWPPIDAALALARINEGIKINSETDCWEWQKSIWGGYGIVRVGSRKSVKVHRLSAHIFWGFDINSSLVICHHCDNPKCCNPSHLFAGTQKDNVQDCFRKGRGGRRAGVLRGRYKPLEFCRKGLHRTIPENRRKAGVHKGIQYYQCRICFNADKMRYYYEAKARNAMQEAA